MAVPEKYEHIDFKPPQGVAEAAEKGLEYRRKQKGDKAGLTAEEAGKQGIGSGVQRAVNLKNRDSLSPETLRMMNGFFALHEKNKAISKEHKGTPWEDNGYVSWLLWGGDPGKRRVDKIMKQMDTADNKEKTQKTGAWLPNISSTLRNKLEGELEVFIKASLDPFPSSDPTRLLSKASALLMKGLDLPSDAKLSSKDAHEFLGTVVGMMSIKMNPNALDNAIAQVVPGSPFVDSSSADRIKAVLSDMMIAAALDPSRGATKGQKKLVRILQRSLPVDEYEALLVLQHLLGELDFELGMASDQLNGLLSGYLESGSRKVASTLLRRRLIARRVVDRIRE